MKYLRSLPELEDFTQDKELQQLMATCKFTEYQDNKVVVGDWVVTGDNSRDVSRDVCHVMCHVTWPRDMLLHYFIP